MNIVIIIKIFVLYKVFIKKLNFIKNIINGGSPANDSINTKIMFFNLLNFSI